jgi:hypothetical protein
MDLSELAGRSLGRKKSRLASVVSRPCRDETASRMGQSICWVGTERERAGKGEPPPLRMRGAIRLSRPQETLGDKQLGRVAIVLPVVAVGVSSASFCPIPIFLTTTHHTLNSSWIGSSKDANPIFFARVTNSAATIMAASNSSSSGSFASSSCLPFRANTLGQI